MSERSSDTSTGAPEAADLGEPQAAGLRSGNDDGALVLAPYGHWQGLAIGELHRRIGALELPRSGRATIDLAELRSVDSAGAWLIHGLALALQGRGVEVAVRNADPDVAGLLDRVSDIQQPSREEMAPADEAQWFMVLERVGRATHAAVASSAGLLSFLGATTVAVVRTVAHPRRLRFTAFVVHVDHTGLFALGVVGMINFLIGLVLAYMGATQLAAFGAEIYAIDLVGIAVLREMGVLLTAIIVAGRSGSAFTAQIGAMKVQQEIDAMRTLGVDPLDALVIPRLFALLLTLPGLTLFGDMAGLIGGAIMGQVVLGIPLAQFYERMLESVSVSTFLVGMSKAPVFAVIIAMVGCYEGLKVGGSAESVGKHTTRSVVWSIFLVIVFDALFAIMYSYLGI